MWMLLAVLSALFAALTTILAKIGLAGVNSNLATAIRTGVVLVMAWIIVFLTGRQAELGGLSGKNWVFLAFSGVATGLSWLCYYRAVQLGPVSKVCLLYTSFMADITRACPVKCDVEFIAVSSYQNATSSSGVVQITHDIQQDISGRHLVVIEDILDSGNTLAFLKQYFQTKGAASVTVCTLLDKPSRRTKAIQADYVGFVVPDEFVVGYGLDYAQKYRNLPYIGVLKPEVYNQ